MQAATKTQVNFPLGRIAATPGALAALGEAGLRQTGTSHLPTATCQGACAASSPRS
jgi:hypothetical protein